MSQNIIFIRISNRHKDDVFPAENRPPFDLIQTSQILKSGYQLHSLIIDEQIAPINKSELTRKIFSLRPKIVVISCLSYKILRFNFLLRTIKECDPGIICIAVGHLATYCAKIICNADSEVDFVIRGEFQIKLAEFLKHLMSHGCIGIQRFNDDVYNKDSTEVSKLHIINNINMLPALHLSAKDLKQYNNLIPLPLARYVIWGRVFSSFGCPHSCIFCTQTIRDTYGRNYRLRDIRAVMNDLEYHKSAGANVIEFCDDNFTASKEHLYSLCDEILTRKIKIFWGSHARIDDLDYTILSLMKRAGCIFIRCGIESGSKRILSSIKHVALAADWIQQAERIFKTAQKLKIMTVANIILGSPGESFTDLGETKKLIKIIKPDILQVHFFCPYPGSTAYADLGVELSEKELAEMHHHSHKSFYHDHESLKAHQRNIILSFYFRNFYMLKYLFKFGPYHALNIDKTIPLIKSMLRLVKLRRVQR